MSWLDDIGGWFSGAGDTVSSWFGGDTPSYTQFDPTLGGLSQINAAGDSVLTQPGMDAWQNVPYNTFLADTQQQQQQQQSSEPFGWSGALSLGLGGLGMLGNLYSQREAQQLAEERAKAEREALEAQTALAREKQALAEQEFGLKERDYGLGAGDDFAKMHALAQIIQDRQGINLDPSLAYAEAIRREQGLTPEGTAGFAGVDIGGALRPSGVAAAKQRALNEALGLTHPQNVAMNRGGLYDYAHGGYAGGGGYNMGGSPRGALALVRGGSSGQADDVNAALSHGEYVVDADVVSALGDGNTDAGARKLDQMRENVRSHKRSASKKSIPPKAKSPERYMKGGK